MLLRLLDLIDFMFSLPHLINIQQKEPYVGGFSAASALATTTAAPPTTTAAATTTKLLNWLAS